MLAHSCSSLRSSGSTSIPAVRRRIATRCDSKLRPCCSTHGHTQTSLCRNHRHPREQISLKQSRQVHCLRDELPAAVELEQRKSELHHLTDSSCSFSFLVKSPPF